MSTLWQDVRLRDCRLAITAGKWDSVSKGNRLHRSIKDR